MMESLLLSLAIEPTKSEQEEISKLNEILGKINMTCGLETVTSEYENSRHTLFKITYDDWETRKKLTRNAGARRKSIKRIRVADIQERMRTENADQIAKELGIGRTTLYRRLREAKECHDEWL